MRRTVLALAVLAGVLAGCGGTEPVPHRAWVSAVCQALQPWRDRLTALNARAEQQLQTATTPAQTRTQLLALLDGARTASADARTKVAGAGVPDVTGGTAIAAHFVGALGAVRDAYGKARDTVRGLPDDRFYAGVATAMSTLTREYQRAGVDAAKLDSAQLHRDFDEVPACR